MGGLEADDEGKPGVVQKVSRGVALGQYAAGDAGEQRSRRYPRHREQRHRYRRGDAHFTVAERVSERRGVRRRQGHRGGGGGGG